MSLWKELGRRILYLGRRSRFDRELDDEVRFHIEQRAAEIQQTGVSAPDALAQARREFGSTASVAEETRSAWRIRWLEDLAADLRYGGRALRRSPGFALTAFVSLALGIGVNTVIFSLTVEFLFSRPSCRAPETIAALQIGGSSHASYREYRFLSDARVFEGLAGAYEEAEVNWRDGENTSRLYAVRITDNFFNVIGTPVALGRPIAAGEKDAIVLSQRFWRNRLGGDPQILGRALVIDGQLYTVAGVLPADHRTLIGFGFAPDLYAPIRDDATSVALYARLPEGMTLAAARDRLRPVLAELDKVYPTGSKRPRTVQVSPLAGLERLTQGFLMSVSAFFAVLMVLVGLVLLIACGNVASMLLARGSSRSQELAIRLSIGASRSRIVRQLMAESLLLAMLGAAAGLALNIWVTRLLSQIRLPLPVPVQPTIEPDWRLLLYASVIAIASALACGLMPALRSARADVNVALKRQERQSGGRRWNLRNVLVAGQMAVSILLLVAGSLFLRNLWKSTAMNPGFDVDRTVWVYVRPVPKANAAPEAQTAFTMAVLDRLRTMHGVDSATIARAVPLNLAVTMGGEVSTDTGGQRHFMWSYNKVGPDYFKTMGIPLLGGREFLAADRSGAAGVVILNENFARRLFDGANPVGRVIRVAGSTNPVTVAGVAANSKYFTLGEEDKLAMYEPYFQLAPDRGDLHFLIRANVVPESLVRPLNTALGNLDATAAVEIKPMRNALGIALLPSRLGAGLLGSIGVLGLTLASIGLYGVLLYAVSRRVREIGVRVALGARPADILQMVFRDSFAVVGIGAAIGLATAAVATRPLAMFLVPGLSPADPVSFAIVLGMLAAVGIAATLAPARRALRVDPIAALRCE